MSDASSPSLLVRIFDANGYDLRGRVSQLRAAGIDRRLDVRTTSSRNALLAAIDEDASSSPRRESVALVDCRAESGDLEQVGFRVIETIRRHARLWKATRPIIWVDELTEANRRFAEAVSAEAVLDDDWLDQSDGTTLEDVISWAGTRQPRPWAGGGEEIMVFSDGPASLEEENRLRDARFERWFGYEPDDLDFVLLWGLADAVELKFLYRYCADEGISTTETAARKACERLQEAMRAEREHLDRAEATNTEIARRFLAEAAPASPDPLAELAWPGIEHMRTLLFDRPDIRDLAYLEPGAQEALERFLGELPAGTVSVGVRHRTVLDAAETVARISNRPAAATHDLLQRSCHALDDAFCDWRAHGPPSGATI